jgi:hypothetical protein
MDSRYVNAVLYNKKTEKLQISSRSLNPTALKQITMNAV